MLLLLPKRYYQFALPIDRAIQIHGGMGVSQDTPLAAMYAGSRTLRLADGPDEVHMYQLGRNTVKQYMARVAEAAS